jgi:DNA-binding XRE family transcriptional regulator
MMMTDEIIQEVWQAKDRIAKQFGYDLDALASELQKRQRESGRRVVSLAREPQPVSRNRIDDALTIGQKIRQARGALTRRQVAVKSGITESTLYDIESGTQKNPKVQTIQAIAEALAVNVAELIGD